MPMASLEKTPGPQYYPGDRQDKKKSSKYTFGYRRNQAGSALKNNTATPNVVGPGKYVPEACALPSTKKNLPKWTLPKAPRLGIQKRPVDKN